MGCQRSTIAVYVVMSSVLRRTIKPAGNRSGFSCRAFNLIGRRAVSKTLLILVWVLMKRGLALQQ